MTQANQSPALPGSVGVEATGPCPYLGKPCVKDSTLCRKWIEVKSTQTTAIVGVTREVTEWKCADDHVMAMVSQTAMLIAAIAMAAGIIPAVGPMPGGMGGGRG